MILKENLGTFGELVKVDNVLCRRCHYIGIFAREWTSLSDKHRELRLICAECGYAWWEEINEENSKG